jgi:uncharacterized membrane protein
MKYINLLQKLSNILFLPILVMVVCVLIFRDTLNTYKYGQLLRYIVLLMSIIVIIGALLDNNKKKKNGKDN